MTTPIKIPVRSGGPGANAPSASPTTDSAPPSTDSTVAVPSTAPMDFSFKACIYGGSNTGKSTQLAAYARYLWKTYRRKTRVFVFDSGGTIAYDPLIKAGVVEMYHMDDFYGGPISPEALFRGLSKGVWFKRTPKKIEVIQEKVLPPDVGALFIEGTDGTCNAIGRDFIERGLKIGQDTVGQYDIEDLATGGSVKGGKIAPSHYGVIQDNMLQSYIPAFWQLPYPDAVVLTTHDGVGKDDDANASGKAYGPALIGSAATRKVPQQTVVLLHADVVGVRNAAGKMSSEYRVYYDPHQDPNNPVKVGATYPANSRLDLHAYGKLKKLYPEQYFISDPMSPHGTLSEFIENWKRLLKESMDDLS